MPALFIQGRPSQQRLSVAIGHQSTLHIQPWQISNMQLPNTSLAPMKKNTLFDRPHASPLMIAIIALGAIHGPDAQSQDNPRINQSIEAIRNIGKEGRDIPEQSRQQNNSVKRPHHKSICSWIPWPTPIQLPRIGYGASSLTLPENQINP